MRRKNIIGTLAGILGSFLMTGCAYLANANRPRYSGPTRAEAWHNSSVKVENTPVICDGIVYAVARPIAEAGEPRLFAFDLKNGKKLWESAVNPTEILCVAQGALYAGYKRGEGIGVVEARTGTSIAPPSALPFSKVTESGGVLYLTGNGVLEARSLSGSSPPLWRASVSLTQPEKPVVASGLVYVYGVTPSEILRNKIGKTGVYAFDAKTGAPRWQWEHPGNLYDLDVTIQNVAADSAAAYVWMKDTSQSPFASGILTALDAATGRERWNYRTEPYAGLAGQPLLLDPQTAVIAEHPNSPSGEAGYLFRALDRATGAKLWESRSKSMYKQLIAVGDLLFVSDSKIHHVIDENNNYSPDSWVTAVDLRSGKELWRSATVELGVLTPPATGERMVVVGSTPFTFAGSSTKGKDEVAGLWAWEATK